MCWFWPSAAKLNFSAQQAGEFPTDRQAQTGTSVLAAGAGICLLEGLEDDALFIKRDSDAGIGDLEGNDRRCATQDRMIFAPSFAATDTAARTGAMFGELA